MSSAFDTHTQTRVAINQLSTLLDLLHPEPGPDVYTLEDFVYRHPLTGLGELAAREIEQSQRINRAQGDFGQIGLCEFHIGLIYLYWGDYRGAYSQYTTARRQWSFIQNPASVSLALFAEGYARELSYHYEMALTCYGKALHSLTRIKFSQQSRNEPDFAELLITFVREAQERVREHLWLPMQEYPSLTPNPGDYCESCIWYRVKNDTDYALLKAGSLLLVMTQFTQYKFTPQDLILVGTNEIVVGSVEIESISSGQFLPYRRIYLAVPQYEWVFTRDVETGRVTLIPVTRLLDVHEDEILGVVMGFWHFVRS